MLMPKRLCLVDCVWTYDLAVTQTGIRVTFSSITIDSVLLVAHDAGEERVDHGHPEAGGDAQLPSGL